MTIDTYYNFIKIIECGSILAASQELLIAQPALSTQLKKLESTLGVTLVRRSSKKITLTPAGEIFYKKAQIICSVDASIYTELKDYINGISGTLKISMTPSISTPLLHFLFDKFVHAHPNVSFQFNEVLSNQVAENVRMGISEIGIIRSPITSIDDFYLLPFRSEELMVILSNEHPLAKYDSLTLEQIKNEPIVTTDVLAPIISYAFQTINTEPIFYLKTAVRRTAIFWVTNYKNCITFLPCSTEELESVHSDCKILKVKDYDFSVSRSFIIAKNRPLSPIACDFFTSINLPCNF